ncbi:MAG: glycoside hydrolase family 3 protein [Alphaproteobacteria bacterium]|nr:glycoside hydrolase family 3 protein [Alphaproteobacteria bacterium]
MKAILPAFLSCQGMRLSADEKSLFSEYNPLGICLFSRFCNNIFDKKQVSALIGDIKEAIGRDNVLIAVDQEGGRVRRLLEPEFTAVTAQQNLNSPEMAEMHAYLISSDLKSCGINVNFAPVLDVMTEKTSDVLKGRCFNRNVAELGKVMVDEYIKNGICPCVKHIPGHGKASVDPHLSLPMISESLSELQTDFAPFKALRDSPMGMVAHIVLSAIDEHNAATVSPKVIREIIRNEIGFSGLLVSDAIVMKALQGSVAEKARKSIASGCDVVCLGNADFTANRELCESGIMMSDEACERLQKIFNVIDKKCEFTEYEQIKNKYCANLKNIITYDYNYDATEVLNRLRDNN